MVRREEIPNFQDVSVAQKALTEGDQWKTFWFYEERDVFHSGAPKAPSAPEAL
jgi:hypothetical protein